MLLQLHWSPRDQNEEADALTNGEYAGFAPEKHVKIDVSSLQWLVLPEMSKVAEDIYSAAKARRSDGGAPPNPPRTKALKLRERDPW